MPRLAAFLATALSLAACSDATGPGDGQTPRLATPGRSTAAVPSGSSGRPTTIVIQGNDSAGRPATRGGATVTVVITGENPGTATVSDAGDGTWTASYVPSRPGVDTLRIEMDGEAISGGPFPSVVEFVGRGTAVIDGRIDDAEWAGASTAPVFTDPRLVGSTLFVMNDGSSLYLALRIPRTSLTVGDRVFFRIDNTLDSVLTIGDDDFGLRGTGVPTDNWFDGTFFVGDREGIFGSAAVTRVGSETHWEFRRPLAGGSDDLVTTVGSRVGLCAVAAIEGTTTDRTSDPEGCLSAGGGQRFFVVHLVAP